MTYQFNWCWLTDFAFTHHHFSFVRPHRGSEPLVWLELQSLPGAVHPYHSVIWREAEEEGQKIRKRKELQKIRIFSIAQAKKWIQSCSSACANGKHLSLMSKKKSHVLKWAITNIKTTFAPLTRHLSGCCCFFCQGLPNEMEFKRKHSHTGMFK